MSVADVTELEDGMEKCPHFNSCNQNFCPLDLKLQKRSGNKKQKCRYMREPRLVKIKSKAFVSGGKAMPDAPLNFVPECNVSWLNMASKERWCELRKNRPKI